MSAEFLLIRPEDRDAVAYPEAGGDVYATLATGAQTTGGYYLVHSIVPPGGGPPAHVHTREEEAFFVIRGELLFLAGDEETAAPAGTFVNVPRGTTHRFRNAGDEEAENDLLVRPRRHRGPVRGAGRAPGGDRRDR